MGNRVELSMYLNEYIHERLHRAVTMNISETGLYVNKVIAPVARRSRVGGGSTGFARRGAEGPLVALEFELPGTGELIWARGEIAYDTLDDTFHGQGIRFSGMARAHARLVRDYCIEKRRATLAHLLAKIRRERRH